MTDITLEELKNMSEEDVRNLNKVLAKKLLKKFGLALLGTVIGIVLADLVSRQLTKKIDAENADQ